MGAVAAKEKMKGPVRAALRGRPGPASQDLFLRSLPVGVLAGGM